MVKKSERSVAIQTSVTIAASHTLKGMGKCENLHGHTWKIQVQMIGDVKHLQGDGTLVEFSHIKSVIRKYDHQHLNDHIKVPTAENFAFKILDDIESFIMFVEELTVTVWESEDSCAIAHAEYFRDD